MATTGDEHDYWGGVHLRVLGSAEESGYRVVDLEWEVPAGQRLVALPHRHTDWPEHFAIVRGTARHWLGRRRLVAGAGDAWVVPAGAVHVHPANTGEEPLVVRQWIELDAPDERLLAGVERYFETIAALTQQGKVDRFGRVKDPLQDALTLSETLVPGTYFPLVPPGWQQAAVERLADVARRGGRIGVQQPV
jgi:mannose-6-phosphate isomerase-like protein (cupin superfamily)